LKAQDALRKAFLKFDAWIDPYSLMELEPFVIGSVNSRAFRERNYESLISNLVRILKSQEIEDADTKAREIAEYIIFMCRKGCD